MYECNEKERKQEGCGKEESGAREEEKKVMKSCKCEKVEEEEKRIGLVRQRSKEKVKENKENEKTQGDEEGKKEGDDKEEQNEEEVTK